MLLQWLGQLYGALDLYTILYGALIITIFLLILFSSLSLCRGVYLHHRQPKNLDRFRLTTSSNLRDQFDEQYTQDENHPLDSPVLIKALYIYPIKSCRPIEVQRALLTKTGFVYDRCFALATSGDKGEWQFISQRTKPQMALMKQELWLPNQHSRPDDEMVKAGGCIIVSFPDPDAPTTLGYLQAILENWSLKARPSIRFTVPLNPTAIQTQDLNTKPTNFRIHSRQAAGFDLGCVASIAAALPKLKRFLKVHKQQNLTLMRCSPQTLVRTERNLAPLEHIGTPALHGYTDQQPLHIMSLSSVHATSEMLPPEDQPLDALRFRANIYISGAPAFAEEQWKRYRVVPNTTPLEPRAYIAPTVSVVCRTSRCTMPNVNPDIGAFERSSPVQGQIKAKPQPSTTLVQYRTVETGNPAALGYLGMHCVPEDAALNEAADQGAKLYVEVGDLIQVLKTGRHLYGSTGNDY